MTLKISFDGTDKRLVEFLKSRMPTVQEALVSRLDALMIAVQAHIVGDKLSGQVLHHRSGHLAASIRPDPPHPVIEGNKIIAGVQGAGPIAVYGRWHEYGTTSSYEIVPTVKKALAFMVEGQQVVVKRVLHPPLKERSFMRSGFADMRETILAGLQKSIDDTLSKP